MQTPNFSNPRKNYTEEYIGKAVLEDTDSVQRVIKLEKRTDNNTGKVTLALVQSVRFDKQGIIPYALRPEVRDILVASPEALASVIALLNSDKLWDELERLVPGITSQPQ